MKTLSIAIEVNDLPIRVQTIDLTKTDHDIKAHMLSFIATTYADTAGRMTP